MTGSESSIHTVMAPFFPSFQVATLTRFVALRINVTGMTVVLVMEPRAVNVSAASYTPLVRPAVFTDTSQTDGVAPLVVETFSQAAFFVSVQLNASGPRR